MEQSCLPSVLYNLAAPIYLFTPLSVNAASDRHSFSFLCSSGGKTEVRCPGPVQIEPIAPTNVWLRVVTDNVRVQIEQVVFVVFPKAYA